METYNDLIVRSHLPVAELLTLIQHTADRFDQSVTWKAIEQKGDITVFYAMAGSGGWDAAETAARQLLDNGHASRVWGYLTHDEDPEAVYFDQTADDTFQFIASTAYLEEEEEQDEHVSFDPSNPEHLEPESRSFLGEPTYCWGSFEYWKRDLPALERIETYQELIESIVGEQ